MAKTANIALRVEPELKAALEKAAAEDVRSLASLVEKILTDWVKTKGKK